MLEINSFPNVMFGTIYQTLRRASCIKRYVVHHVKTLCMAICIQRYVCQHVSNVTYDNMYQTLCIVIYITHYVNKKDITIYETKNEI